MRHPGSQVNSPLRIVDLCDQPALVPLTVENGPPAERPRSSAH